MMNESAKIRERAMLAESADYRERANANESAIPQERRNGHPRFYELLERMADLHARKNHDYAGPRDPLRNLRRCADAGIPPWKGVVVRLSDKFDRLLTFAELEEYAVKDESVADTFLDMAVYALLGLILYEEKLPGCKNLMGGRTP